MKRAFVWLLLLAACPDFDHALSVCQQHGGCADGGVGGGGVGGGLGGGSGGGAGGAILHVALSFDAGMLDAGVLDAGTLDGLPVLVSFQAAQAADVADPGHELRFVDDRTGIDLPFEVDHWNASGESACWVRLARLDGPATLTLHHGPGANGAADAGAVWSGYELVHHFEAGLRSSVDERYAGDRTGNGAVAGVGQVGQGSAFTGTSSQRVDFADGGALFDGWSAFTFTLWVYADYPDAGAITGEPLFLDKGGPIAIGRVLPQSGPGFQVDMHFTGTNNDAFMGGDLPLRQWVLVGYTFDGTTLRSYSNGLEMGSQTMNGAPRSMTSSTQGFHLGGDSNVLAGAVDELFIERRAHDAAWMLAQYQSMTRQLAVVSP